MAYPGVGAVAGRTDAGLNVEVRRPQNTPLDAEGDFDMGGDWMQGLSGGLAGEDGMFGAISAMRRWGVGLLLILVGAAGAAAAAAPRDERDMGEGRGEDDIVLVHGLGSSAAVWDEVAALLGRGLRVWTFELPGHGRTAPVRQLTIGSAAERLGDYLREHDIVQPVLVGHAMGGLIVLRYALEHPRAARRLVVIDAAPRQLADEAQKGSIADRLVRDYDGFLAERYGALSADADISRRLVDQALRTDERSLRSLLISSFDVDLTGLLARQETPILVIGSEGFFPVAGHEIEQLDRMGYSAARTISFKRMEGTGHFMMLERPQYLASVLAAFALGE